MSYFFALLVCKLIGVLAARKPDTIIDINRVLLMPRETSSHLISNQHLHNRHHIYINQFNRNNDNDDHSSRLVQVNSPLHSIHDFKASTDPSTSPKFHQPREDPRLFYESVAYLKENNRKNANEEVASIYPGREVIRVNKEAHQKPFSMSLRYKEQNYLSTEGLNICVKCPHDRTLVAKPGINTVILQKPRLFSCSGKKASRNIHFVHLYGPTFGSLLEQGSHTIIGRIMHKGNSLQLCKMQVHVVVQGCSTPKSLVSHCEDQNKPCNFTCRNIRSQLHGPTSLVCGDNMKWNGKLPTCRARTWCEAPHPPENGTISCQGDTVDNGLGFVEGSRCRIRCARGWRWSPKAIAICHRGAWTHKLICQPEKRICYQKK